MTENDRDQEKPGEEPAAAAESPTAGEPVAAEAKPEPPPKPPWMVDPSAPEWHEDEGELVSALRSKHGDVVLWSRTFAGDLVLGVRTDAIADICRSLKDDHGYAYIVDICGVDYPDRDQRFEVVYQVYNIESKHRLRLKVSVDEDGEVPTVSHIWVGANWPEREAWDMYGIPFAGHPDLTRILTWEGFSGHPLRKDFPIEGVETGAAIYPEYYDESQGPISGTGTGWKVPTPPEPEPEPEPEPTAETPEPNAVDESSIGSDAAGESA